MIIISIENRVTIVALYFKNSRSPKQVLRKLEMQYMKKETLSKTSIRRIINQFMWCKYYIMENKVKSTDRGFLLFFSWSFFKDNVYRKHFQT